MAAETGPGDVFVQYRPNRRRWLVAGAVLGAVLLVLGILYVVRSTVYSPTAVVDTYFDALADRDAAAALRVTDVDTGADDLLTSAVLESADYAPPEEVDITELTVDGRTAAAEVTFHIGGNQQPPVTLRLERTDGVVDAVFQRWRITDGVRPIHLGESPGEVTVNGEPVQAHDIDGPRALPALLGGYQVGVPDGDPLWQARTVAVLVGPDRDGEVDVPLAARPEVRDEVERQVVAILDDCAASTELRPPGCPFSNTRIDEASNVAWRISSYPGFRLTAGPDGFGEVAMLVQATADGEAVVTGTRVAFGTEQPFETIVPFPVSGVVSEREGTLAFDPDW